MRPLAVALLLILAVGGCTTSAGAPSSAGPTAAPSAVGPVTSVASSDGEPAELTVFAAASLRAALDAIEPAYEAAVPGTTLTVSTDSSAALATQIEQGAPADVFLSADLAAPQRLADAGLTDGPVVPFAGNLLTVIVPADDPAAIVTPADLADDGVRIIAAGDEVPISRYAATLVRNLAALDGYPGDFAARYAANVVSKEDNVAGVVTKIELGEGDAGIVYLTDAAQSDAVASVPVPADANVAATYGAVIVGERDRRSAARAFLDWLTGTDGQAILGGFGFTAPPG